MTDKEFKRLSRAQLIDIIYKLQLELDKVNEEKQELENQLALVESQMRTLKASVDASALPEERLQEIVDYVVANKNADPRALLSIVYRVEVGADYIHIWTMLDTDPSGTFEEDESGLLITPGITSGVPKHSNPNLLPIGETFGFVVFLNNIS